MAAGLRTHRPSSADDALGRRLVDRGISAPDGIEVRPADLGCAELQSLIVEHKRQSAAASGQCADHSLDLARFKDADLRLWSAHRGGGPLGVGALQTLDPTHGEVKTMFTHDDARGLGVGAAILEAILASARDAGMTRLSLETGAPDYFAAARRLYERAGFSVCPPFGRYREDPRSVFMTLTL